MYIAETQDTNKTQVGLEHGHYLSHPEEVKGLVRVDVMCYQMDAASLTVRQLGEQADDARRESIWALAHDLGILMG